jgi:hypothetical protein
MQEKIGHNYRINWSIMWRCDWFDLSKKGKGQLIKKERRGLWQIMI